MPKKLVLAIQSVVSITFFGSESTPVSAAILEQRYGLNRRALEPVLQPLVKSGVLSSSSGMQGGYFVANPKATTIADIARTFITPSTNIKRNFHEFEEITHTFLEEIDDALLEKMQGITIQSLCDKAHASGIIPSLQPIDDYVI